MCVRSAGGRNYPTIPVVGRVWLSVNGHWRLCFERRGAVLGNLRASPVLRTALRVRLADWGSDRGNACPAFGVLLVRRGVWS